MSVLRTLVIMPFVIPALAIAGIAYMADAALTDSRDATPESAGSSPQDGRRRHDPRNLDTPLGVTSRTDCRAIDGDTLRCGRLRIRLLGVDAAELPGHCATGRDCAPGDPFAQKRALAALVGGSLSINTIKTDRYGRGVADVTASDGTNLSCAMLAAGASYVAKWDDGDVIARKCPLRALSGS